MTSATHQIASRSYARQFEYSLQSERTHEHYHSVYLSGSG